MKWYHLPPKDPWGDEVVNELELIGGAFIERRSLNFLGEKTNKPRGLRELYAGRPRMIVIATVELANSKRQFPENGSWILLNITTTRARLRQRQSTLPIDILDV
jgi:hypothetical protein